jgi:hypothetical protein
MIKTYMDSVTEAYKNKIGERLTLRLIRAVKDKEITQAELATISSYILENIEEAQSNSEVLEFLEDVAQKWPFLSALLSAEQVEEAEVINKQRIEQVGTLINQNKIDEALQVATDANNRPIGGEN